MYVYKDGPRQARYQPCGDCPCRNGCEGIYGCEDGFAACTVCGVRDGGVGTCGHCHRTVICMEHSIPFPVGGEDDGTELVCEPCYDAAVVVVQPGDWVRRSRASLPGTSARLRVDYQPMGRPILCRH